MNAIMEFLGGGLSGGLFGILGGLGTSWLKMKADERAHKYKLEEMKAKQEYNLKMVEVETTATLREIDANVKRDQIMMDGKADVEESKIPLFAQGTKVEAEVIAPVEISEEKEQELERPNESDQRQVKPQLGRTIDGTRNRVDRLRLLGNGVVPYTAAKAFTTLIRSL